LDRGLLAFRRILQAHANAQVGFVAQFRDLPGFHGLAHGAVGFVGVGAIAEFAGRGKLGELWEVERDFFGRYAPEPEVPNARGVDNTKAVVEFVEPRGGGGVLAALG